MKKILILSALTLFVCVQKVHAQGPTVPASITDADEVRIGRILAEKFAAREGLEPTPQTRKIDEYLQKVGARVAAFAQRKLPYQFHFDPNPGFKSAIGLPGGQIFVGGGILAYMDTEDQLAAVLGHELEHIALNQCRDRLIQILTERHLSAREADELDIESFLSGYGHDNEFAADREGVKLAMQAGYSPTGAIRLLQTFVILAQQMPHTPSESEKNLQDRIAQIESLTRGNTAAIAVREIPLALPFRN
jgi:predicted Zn-dependent protease